MERTYTFEDQYCFAVTELAHGSNVRGIQTTATYDRDTDEFVIHSPTKEAMKFWIGAAAMTANMAVVFAQLIVNGESEGPHAFIVPLRDRKEHLPLAGITIGDCGLKAGYNEMDNAFILFDHVRIPKENLLNKYS